MTTKLIKSGLLLSALLVSSLAWAQNGQVVQFEEDASAELPRGVLALPEPPPLPGEEKLSARERAERDFIMPTRRKKGGQVMKRATPLSTVPRHVPKATVPRAVTRRRTAE